MQVCTCDICGARLEVHEDDFAACEPAEDVVCPVCRSDVVLAVASGFFGREHIALS